MFKVSIYNIDYNSDVISFFKALIKKLGLKAKGMHFIRGHVN